MRPQNPSLDASSRPTAAELYLITVDVDALQPQKESEQYRIVIVQTIGGWAQTSIGAETMGIFKKLNIEDLCVPNIRFSMDAESRRGKFAT